jgi:hypothetical protein
LRVARSPLVYFWFAFNLERNVSVKIVRADAYDRTFDYAGLNAAVSLNSRDLLIATAPAACDKSVPKRAAFLGRE